MIRARSASAAVSGQLRCSNSIRTVEHSVHVQGRESERARARASHEHWNAPATRPQRPREAPARQFE